jgi:hypothetical protein
MHYINKYKKTSLNLLKAPGISPTSISWNHEKVSYKLITIFPKYYDVSTKLVSVQEMTILNHGCFHKRSKQVLNWMIIRFISCKIKNNFKHNFPTYPHYKLIHKSSFSQVFIYKSVLLYAHVSVDF